MRWGNIDVWYQAGAAKERFASDLARYAGQVPHRSTKDAIEATLLAAGPGARGMVAYATGRHYSRVRRRRRLATSFQRRGRGHVVNAVNDRGVVRYLDGQAGTVVELPPKASRLSFLPSTPEAGGLTEQQRRTLDGLRLVGVGPPARRSTASLTPDRPVSVVTLDGTLAEEPGSGPRIYLIELAYPAGHYLMTRDQPDPGPMVGSSAVGIDTLAGPRRTRKAASSQTTGRTRKVASSRTTGRTRKTIAKRTTGPSGGSSSQPAVVSKGSPETLPSNITDPQLKQVAQILKNKNIGSRVILHPVLEAIYDIYLAAKQGYTYPLQQAAVRRRCNTGNTAGNALSKVVRRWRVRGAWDDIRGVLGMDFDLTVGMNKAPAGFAANMPLQQLDGAPVTAVRRSLTDAADTDEGSSYAQTLFDADELGTAKDATTPLKATEQLFGKLTAASYNQALDAEMDALTEAELDARLRATVARPEAMRAEDTTAHGEEHNDTNENSASEADPLFVYPIRLRQQFTRLFRSLTRRRAQNINPLNEPDANGDADDADGDGREKLVGGPGGNGGEDLFDGDSQVDLVLPSDENAGDEDDLYSHDDLSSEADLFDDADNQVIDVELDTEDDLEQRQLLDSYAFLSRISLTNPGPLPATLGGDAEALSSDEGVSTGDLRQRWPTM